MDSSHFGLAQDDRPILSIVGLGYIDDMDTPKFQFSLRSLLLLVMAVALLCSLGKCTHWLGPVILAAVVLTGGIAGRIVAGIKAGFMEGALYGTFFFLIVLSVSGWWAFAFPSAWESGWLVKIGIAVLIGGILGGFTVRPRSRQ